MKKKSFTVNIHVPYYHGVSDMTTEESATLKLKIPRKQLEELVLKHCNGYVEKGRIYAGSGDEISPRLEEITAEVF